MLTKELNDLLLHVGPGTAGGEFLRRYWWPVGLSKDSDSGGQPKEIRVMGEDLVLFRDQQGRPGLVGLHCSLYDVSGSCLEQPAEPDPTFRDRIRHPAYPCQELGGLIFAYLGPPER